MEQERQTATEVGDPATNSLPGRADCLEQLDRMVRGGALSIEARSFALLSYMIEHFLRDPRAPLKAYAVAVEVLGRGSGFDPAQDSIVRVEIGRLRKLLEMYSLGPGRADPVVFQIPKGQTHLDVRYRTPEPREAPGTTATTWISARRPPWPRLLFVAGAVVALAVVLAIGIRFMRDPGAAEVAAALDEDFPRVFVRPFAKSGGLDQAYAEAALSTFIALELSSFGSFRVIAPRPETSLPVRPRDYVLLGEAMARPAGPNQEVLVSLSLRDGVGTVLWTGRLSLTTVTEGGSEPIFMALSEVVSALGGSLGAIDAEGRARLKDTAHEWKHGTASDFQCILRWQSFDLTKDKDEQASARTCLEDRASNDTPIAQIWAALAFMRYLDWAEAGASADDPMFEDAMAAANRALLLEPDGAEGHEALGSILTGIGRYDDARELLARALELNRSNLETVVKLGWLDCLAGDWEAGVETIGAVVNRYAAVPGWYRIPLALSAFHHGDASTMQKEAAAIRAAGDRRGRVLELVAARLAKDAAAEAKVLRAMHSEGLEPAAAIREIEAVFPDAVLLARMRQVLRGQ
jgi:tetratricopeptide (TPR) repeat protein